MSSWDTPSAVSVGEKPKNHHHRAEVVQLVKAPHRNLKELVQTKQQKCSLQKTDTRVHTRCCEFTGIHWRAALWPYPWVLQQCSKPNHDKPFRKALWTDIHTTAQHQTSPSRTGISHQLTFPWGEFKPNIMELFIWIPVERREFHIKETVSWHW